MAQMPMPAQGPQDTEDQQEGAEPAMSPQDLIVGVNDGLSKLTLMLEKAQGVDPMAKKSISDALMSFQTGVQALLGKGGAGPVAATGASPMEAGGSDKAVPAM